MDKIDKLHDARMMAFIRDNCENADSSEWWRAILWLLNGMYDYRLVSYECYSKCMDLEGRKYTEWLKSMIE